MQAGISSIWGGPTATHTSVLTAMPLLSIWFWQLLR